MPPGARDFSGRTVAVEPTTVSFGNSRFFVVENHEMEIVGEGMHIVLPRRFVDNDNTPILGPIGILDVDIFAKAGVDRIKLGKLCQEALVGGLAGDRDYHVSFFKGLGESNMGLLSNRPCEIDRSSYPPKEVYLAASGPKSVLASIKAVAAGEPTSDADLILKSDISLTSEVVETLDVPRGEVSPDDPPPILRREKATTTSRSPGFFASPQSRRAGVRFWRARKAKANGPGNPA
jgi:hypothetical protein